MTPREPESAQALSGRWLVLGASGFIGRTAVALLRSAGRQVVAVDQAPPADAAAGVSFVCLEVNGAAPDALRGVLQDVRPTVLLNAIGHAPGAAEDGLHDTYVRGTDALLGLVRNECPCCRVLLLGSAAEYGNAPECRGSKESDDLHPLSAYGRAKCAQFEVANRYRTDGMAVTTARLFNVIGPGQGRHLFVGALLERIRAGESPLRVMAANHIRDWIDVRDATRALLVLADAAHPPAVANVATGLGFTVGHVAGLVAELAGVPVCLQDDAIVPTVPWRSQGDPECLANLGWRSSHTLTASLHDQWASAGSPRSPG